MAPRAPRESQSGAAPTHSEDWCRAYHDGACLNQTQAEALRAFVDSEHERISRLARMHRGLAEAYRTLADEREQSGLAHDAEVAERYRRHAQAQYGLAHELEA